MSHTPGPWKISPNVGGTVISVVPIDTNGIDTGHNHKEYYGGYCIAESISRDADLSLIIAAPDLLSVLEELNDDALNKIDDPEFWARVDMALQKARGDK